MANNCEKPWTRPWSMDEMISNSENWSLAGDVALLNTIKAYSENLFSKTASVSDNVDNMLHSLDEVGLKLDLLRNQFQSLRNTQFIESRVYEDDETLALKEEEKPEQKAPSEEEREKLAVGAVTEGLRVMNSFFEVIPVSISDSEDEESDKSYVLRPKDLYADRSPLLVIGSEEWYKKAHVGLADSSSESESEEASEIYSDSESEDDLPKDLIKGSETSSELDLSSQTSDNRPVANSTFNETSKKPNVFGSDEESDHGGSVPVKAPISSKSFAEQLAAKLGDVASERQDISPEVNKKPIQPAQTNKFAGDLFSDEPPPLEDDLDDTILPKSAKQGLFSGGQGLFDDNEDDLFWQQQKEEPKAKKTVDSYKEPPKIPKVNRDLFDSDSDNSDEGILSAKTRLTVKRPLLQPLMSTAPLFDEEPPELQAGKKLAEEEKKSAETVPKKTEIERTVKLDNSKEEKPKQKVISLFDDDSEDDFSPNTAPQLDLFGELEKTDKPEAKPRKILDLFAADDLVDEEEEDLFAIKPKLVASDTPKERISVSNQSVVTKDEVDKSPLKPVVDPPPRQVIGAEKLSEGSRKVTRGLFDDSPDLSDDEDLFKELNVKEEPRKTGLFEELGPETAVESVGEIPQHVEPSPKPLVQPRTTKTEPKPSTEIENSQLGNTTNLFESTLPTPQLSESSKPPVQPRTINAEPSNVTEPEPENVTDKSQTRNTINLFGSTPPPDDDDWDTKSVQSSDNEDQFAYRVDYNAAGSSLFDNEPPSLGPNESSGIVRDENITRVDTDTESSFNPYASSSRRLSSDIFNEQQSQDSFFVTKNKTESISVAPQLDKIPESGISSNLDITPSGDLNDLYDSKGDSSVFEDTPTDSKPSVSTSKKPISLFDDFDHWEDTDDLFSSISKSSAGPKLSDKRLSLFDNIDDVLEDSVKRKTSLKDEKKITEETEKLPKEIDTKNEPPVATNNEKYEKKDPAKTEELQKEADTKNKPVVASKEERDVKESPTALDSSSKAKQELDNSLDENVKPETSPKVEEKIPEKTKELPKETEVKNKPPVGNDDRDVKKTLMGSPGKLKHNLKINVGALMPGAAPPKLRDIKKSHSLDLSKEQATTPLHVSSPELGFFTPTAPNPPRDGSSTSSEKAVSFEDALDNIEVLHSVTKDRAKIPIKRRPSTRRGRQRTIQDVSSDVTPEPGIQKADSASKSPETEPQLAEPTTQQESPQRSSSDDSSTPSFQTPTEPQRTSIFDDVGEPFIPSPVKNVEEKPKSSIFESEDSDSDLFGTKGAKKAKKEGAPKKTEKVKKKSLFNDSSSDDELFSGTGGGNSRKKENIQRTIEKKPQRPSATRKLQNIEADDDPLSSLLK